MQLCKQSSWNSLMMARLLPYICFILLILPMRMEAQAGRLGPTPDDEVEALREIAGQLGKKDWNWSLDPCINDTSWTTTPNIESRPLYNNSVLCNCSYPGGVCHIESIVLKGEDLDSILPPALVKLPYLKTVDLNRNYLSGNIPREWASMQLEFLSLSVNNLSGSIPSYLGNIPTLQYLSLENNMFSGNIPHELGQLVNLEHLILSANDLTGKLPMTFTHLNKLIEFRISSNNFTGKIPDYFQSWKQLEQLEIQGSGLEGPIPSSISVLKNLTELRISGLHGEGSDFPSLINMTNMLELTLSSCNIFGKIPAYIANMTHLGKLDLSFNRLEKQIPDFEGLKNLTHMYLTSNLLSGIIPRWTKNSKQNIDLSYNNLTQTSEDTCTGTTLNLFKSFHGLEKSTLGVCPEDDQCSQDYYSLYINCGGSFTTIGSITYEGDRHRGGPSKFYQSGNWGFSSTGHFQNVPKLDSEIYIANNVSILKMHDNELYINARLSPISFTYYMRCLANGKYTVKLHFAEIVIRGNRSFYSLGRRIFDVYIQGELKLKDFEIEKEAKGVDRAVIMHITSVPVTKKSLEIRFHWAGKGTTAAPKRGIYGPLISAISVESNFRSSKWKISIAVGAVVVFALFVILMILGILRWKGCLGGKISR